MRDLKLPPVVGVIALSIVVFFAYLQWPGLGDDFTYWKVGYGVATHVPGAWRTDNFHDLRWPVWGLCWLFFKLTGSSLAAYYGPALLILTASALIVFAITRKMTGRELPAWGATGLFLLHPLIDVVSYRPMPDLAEGLWTALTILAWTAMMRAEKVGGRAGFALLCGLFLAVAHSNRFTGLLLIPALGILTGIFFPRRWTWMLLAVAAAGGFILLECAIYHQVTGDWLHSLHTNMGAKGKKGTESVNLLYLPFRFLDNLWKGNRLSPVYLVAALIGGISLWRKREFRWRMPVLWFLIMFLAYSCALQQLWPPRPMLREASRFMATLAIPLSILAMAGWAWLWKLVEQKYAARSTLITAMGRRPIWLVGLGLVAIASYSERGWFNLGYIPEFRRYVRSRPPDTTVLTHESLWYYTHLSAQKEAARLNFLYQANIYYLKDDIEKMAVKADEIWFSRKLLMLRTRKNLLDELPDSSQRLSSFLESPQGLWRCSEIIKVADTPDLVFYQRSKSGVPVVLGSADLPGVPAFPLIWKGDERKYKVSLPIPATIRGHRVRLKVRGRANLPQPLQAQFYFNRPGLKFVYYEMKPLLFLDESTDFFNFEVPPQAETLDIVIVVDKKTKELSVSSFEVVVD